ncbi:MAG: acyl carrier protein [Clostridiales bacterium]|nr:acyl carrier protein [Clostridiales bacterium]
MTTFETVAAMISKQLRVDVNEITEDKRLVQDLKADSANIMVMIMDMEDAFDITVEDDAITSMRTVGDIVAYIDAHK